MFCSWMTHSARWLQWKVRHLLSHPVSPWTCLGNYQSKVTGRAGTLPWQTVGETSVVFAVWIILSSHWTPLPLTEPSQRAHEGGLFLNADILSHWTTYPQNSPHWRINNFHWFQLPSLFLFFSLYFSHSLSLVWFCELIWCVKPQPSTSTFLATYLAHLIYLF